MSAGAAKRPRESATGTTPSEWESIGTIVGDASTGEFTFILRSFKSRVGDIVAVPMEVPNDDYSGVNGVIAWAQVLSIERYNPFFPYESAQELSASGIPLVDTPLSMSRDQLQVKALVLGFTSADLSRELDLYPLTYPIPPAAEVKYPSAASIKKLLAGALRGQTPIRIGTLIARSDVEVEVSAQRIASRHLAILAMTGGGKTVATRRILRELIDIGYPLVILDPHGDYLGLWENRRLFPRTAVKLFYPHLVMTAENRGIVEILISKMTDGLTPAQDEFLGWLLGTRDPKAGEPVLSYIDALIAIADAFVAKRADKTERDDPATGHWGASTGRAVRRSLDVVRQRLSKMEASNRHLREYMKGLTFERLAEPEGRPEGVVRPWQVSILYLGGYDHLTQSTIVSILLEALFQHRADLTNRIPPFLTVVEEAHNFVPSTREGIAETPSLPTILKLITEGRKFGVGLVLITQRPSRVDETVLSQCNTFLVLRIVNPRDQGFVKSVMENLSDSQARMLPGFGPGQGIISGQAVRFPLLVKIGFDADLLGSRTGDENFIAQAREWKEDPSAPARQRAAETAASLAGRPSRSSRR